MTRITVLVENQQAWIHATRVKLVKEAPPPEASPDPDPREVLTGADGPDLEQEGPEAREVLTGVDDSDLEQDSQEKGVFQRQAALTL